MSTTDPNTPNAPPVPHRRRAARRATCLLTAAAAVAVLATGCGAAAASTPDARHTVQHLKALGLPIFAVKTFTAANDPNALLGRPGEYTSKANFRDRRLGAPGFDPIQDGGSVEVFATNTAAQRRYKYVHAITQSAPIFFEYDYLHGRALLRLSHRLTPAQAHRYAAALNRSS
jgi:hypothetical protein